MVPLGRELAVDLERLLKPIAVRSCIRGEREPQVDDPEKWKPLLMSFRQLFVRGDSAGPSRLARGDEATYAPWKRGLVQRTAARAVGAFARAARPR